MIVNAVAEMVVAFIAPKQTSSNCIKCSIFRSFSFCSCCCVCVLFIQADFRLEILCACVSLCYRKLSKVARLFEICCVLLAALGTHEYHTFHLIHQVPGTECNPKKSQERENAKWNWIFVYASHSRTFSNLQKRPKRKLTGNGLTNFLKFENRIGPFPCDVNGNA